MRNHCCQKHSELKKNPFSLNLFLILSFISLVCTIVIVALSEGGALNNMLFGEDYFMDFYNSMCDAGTKGVYTERGVIYPPLSCLFFFLISKMVPHKYIMLNPEGGERLRIYSDGICQLIYILLTAMVVFALGVLLYDVLQRSSSKYISFLASFFLLFSFPMIYCVQRGNTALLALLLSAFFVFYRNSNNKVVRELSYLALALGAGIKLFPAFFGVLLIFDKKYKAAGRLILYGILAFFVPFAFYGGISGISVFIKNLYDFSGVHTTLYSLYGPSVTNALAWLAIGLGKDISLMIKITKAAAWICCAFIILFADEEWKKLIGICLLLANIDSTARVYILIFLIIPFISFILNKGHKSSKKDIFYGILFCLLLISIPCFWYFKVESITDFLRNMGIGTLSTKPLMKPNAVTEPFIVMLFELSLFIDTAAYLRQKRAKKN